MSQGRELTDFERSLLLPKITIHIHRIAKMVGTLQPLVVDGHPTFLVDPIMDQALADFVRERCITDLCSWLDWCYVAPDDPIRIKLAEILLRARVAVRGEVLDQRLSGPNRDTVILGMLRSRLEHSIINLIGDEEKADDFLQPINDEPEIPLTWRGNSVKQDYRLSCASMTIVEVGLWMLERGGVNIVDKIYEVENSLSDQTPVDIMCEIAGAASIAGILQRLEWPENALEICTPHVTEIATAARKIRLNEDDPLNLIRNSIYLLLEVMTKESEPAN